MTEIEQKALALVNEYFYVERTDLDSCDRFDLLKALCLSIERHETFRQEVSDAVESLCNTVLMSHLHRKLREMLSHRFIIAKPDPLVAVMDDFMSMDGGCLEECVKQLRVALARRGLEVREIEG